MPKKLLPAPAAAFKPRPLSVNVVLGSQVEPWLSQTLKRINRVKRTNRAKRPLNSVLQLQQYLTEMVSSPDAIWTLASIMLPKTTKADFKRDQHSPPAEAMNYDLIHVEAYIVYIDMVLKGEVAYKLTEETIKTLVENHKEIYCVDAMADTYYWPGKEEQCNKLHEDFVQDINKFVFRTPVLALEGLEDEGGGELLGGRSEEVKKKIISLIKPLLPPPPRAVNVVQQRMLLPHFSESNVWSGPSSSGALAALGIWTGYSSSLITPDDSNTDPFWVPMATTAMRDLPPNPPFTYPYPAVSSLYSWPQVKELTPALSLPSILLNTEYGARTGMTGICYTGGFGWDRY